MDMHTYEDNMLDDTISQLTSKLPTPPPRPASLASSTRSSKRSSTASSMTNPNMKHFETNASDAPPTPSIAEIYTNGGYSLPSPFPSQAQTNSYMSLGDELAMSNGQQQPQQQYFSDISARSSVASTSMNQPSRDSGYNTDRNQRPRPSINSMASTSSSVASNGSSAPKKKSSKQHLKGGEGPSIVIGVRGSPASSVVIASSAVRSSRSLSVSNQQKPQRPPRSKRSMDLRHEREKDLSRKPAKHSPSSRTSIPASRLTRARKSVVKFVMDILRAALLLWREILFPLSIGMLGFLISPLQNNSSKSRKKKISTPKIHTPEESQDGVGKAFAEKFKFALCTSNLLTSSLSIASYDSAASNKRAESTEGERKNIEKIVPTSTFAIQEIRGMLRQGDYSSTDPSSSPLELTQKSKILLKACLQSILILYPLSPTRDVWLQTSLLLASMIWGFIAVLGVQVNSPLQFETTHKPTGLYKPSLFDDDETDDEVDGNKDHLTQSQKRRIKERMQLKLMKLIKACKLFDVECNKALAVVQETELISRGYKITHPLPPISRIELSHSRASSSPPRSRNGSHQGSSVPSRYITNGRPLNAHSHSFSAIPGDAEVPTGEPIRMANVRKSLAYAFEDVNGMLKSTINELKPLVDTVEMDLLREMYELEDKRRSSILMNETSDSNTNYQRGSWNSRAGGIAVSDTTRLSSSPTNEDHHSSPRTPQNRDSLLENSLLDKFGSIRKGENGVWDTPPSISGSVGNATTGIRPGSRLSYISDKSPTNVTSFTGPNQNGALKRLSYSSAGSLSGGVGVIPAGTSYKRASLQPAPRNLSGHGRRQGSVQLLLNNNSTNDESRPTSPLLPMPNMVSPVSPDMMTSIDGYKIISLKSSFEEMHSIRRRVLCCLLALDFTLADQIQIKTSSIKLTNQYWSRIGGIMSNLTENLEEFGENVRTDVQKEINVKKAEDTVQDLPKRDSLGYLIDYSGFQDRLIAMGESLRSVQIKMRLCADELQMRGPPPLHGDTSEENSSVTAFSEKRSSTSSEALFGTIRDDLLQLSAEWEAATKIMRMNGMNKADENVSKKAPEQSETSSSSDSNVSNGALSHPAGVVGSLLESPQEAEEDAMREWAKNRRAQFTSDLSLEAAAIEAGLKQILKRAKEKEGVLESTIIQDESQESDKKIEEDLSLLLLRSTSPQSLPPPGIATVYEDVAKPAEYKKHSNLSREERIRLMKEQRNQDAQQLASHANKHTSGVEMTNGMMSELRTVMKNRQSAIIDGKLQKQLPTFREDVRPNPRPATSPTQQTAQESNLTKIDYAMANERMRPPTQSSIQLQRKPATRKYTG